MRTIKYLNRSGCTPGVAVTMMTSRRNGDGVINAMHPVVHRLRYEKGLNDP